MRSLCLFFLALSLAVASPEIVLATTVDDAKAATSRKDYPLALRLWQELAAHEDPGALFAIAMFYDSGWSVVKDQSEAARWFLRAARRGHEGAQEALFHAYSQGLGVPVDYLEAEYWIRPLADKGYPLAQVYLAALELRKPNSVEAYKWLILAKREKLSSDIATKGLENVRKGMSLADVDKAERLASEWRPQPKQPKG